MFDKDWQIYITSKESPGSSWDESEVLDIDEHFNIVAGNSSTPRCTKRSSKGELSGSDCSSSDDVSGSSDISGDSSTSSSSSPGAPDCSDSDSGIDSFEDTHSRDKRKKIEKRKSAEERRQQRRETREKHRAKKIEENRNRKKEASTSDPKKDDDDDDDSMPMLPPGISPRWGGDDFTWPGEVLFYAPLDKTFHDIAINLKTKAPLLLLELKWAIYESLEEKKRMFEVEDKDTVILKPDEMSILLRAKSESDQFEFEYESDEEGSCSNCELQDDLTRFFFFVQQLLLIRREKKKKKKSQNEVTKKWSKVNFSYDRKFL